MSRRQHIHLLPVPGSFRDIAWVGDRTLIYRHAGRDHPADNLYSLPLTDAGRAAQPRLLLKGGVDGFQALGAAIQ